MRVNSGQGVGKAHHNRHPRRGQRASWLGKVEEIVERVEASRLQYFNRRDIEEMFDLRTWAACKLMRQVGNADEISDALGTHGRVLARKDVLLFIRKVAASDGAIFERERRQKVERVLSEAVTAFKARKIKIIPIPAADSMDNLPAGIKLVPGLLQIEFFGVDDLTKQLWTFSQAVLHDYARFEKMCER